MATTDAVQVPPITERERIPQAAIDETVRQIVEQFHPHLIILFGSYAYGQPRPESDVDLLVVMETPLKLAEQSLVIRRALDRRFGLDLLVHTPATLAQRLEMEDFFLREVVAKGRVVYESSDS